MPSHCLLVALGISIWQCHLVACDDFTGMLQNVPRVANQLIQELTVRGPKKFLRNPNLLAEKVRDGMKCPYRHITDVPVPRGPRDRILLPSLLTSAETVWEASHKLVATRYFSLAVDSERDKAWLGAKQGVWPDADTGSYYALWHDCDARLRCAPGEEKLTAEGEDDIAHNMALGGVSARNHTLWGLGGVGASRANGSLLFTREPSGEVRWGRSGIYAHSPGCLELRPDFGRRCMFDGRITTTMLDGQLLAYVRANARLGGGGRHVSVAVAPSSLPPSLDSPLNWSRMELVTFLPPPASDWPDGNVAELLADEARTVETADIYLSSVVAYGNALLGLFPVTVAANRTAVIALAVSCDGRHFSSAVPVVSGLMGGHGEINDHPVNGLFVTAEEVHMYVHHGVPGTFEGRNVLCPFLYEDLAYKRLPRSHIARYSMPTSALDKHVARAKEQLRNAGQCVRQHGRGARERQQRH